MKRRDFLATTAAVSAATMVKGDEKASGGKKPNLLIVHCDELNFRTLGCYRDTLSEEQAFMWGKKAVVETPFIDSLAKEGMLWTKCYAAAPVCSPSRSSLLTGRYPQNTPVVTNNVHMDTKHETFASYLQKAGYATGYAGKWHLGGSGKPGWEPEDKFGFGDNRYMFNRGHWKQFEDTPEGPRVKARKNGKPTYSVEGADEKSFATDWLMDKCIEYVSEHKDEPFCSLRKDFAEAP